MRFALLALVGSLLLVSACKRNDDGQTRGSSPALTPADKAAKASRRGAMLSVYYHALSEGDAAPDTDTERPPMPLDEATQILRDGKGEVAESKRRLAIAKLASAQIESPRFRHALGVLGAPLDKIGPIVANRQPEESRLGGLPNRSATMIGVMALLDELWGPSNKACQRTLPVSKLEWVSNERLAKVLIRMSVKRTDGLDGLRTAIDPQNWDRCSDFIDAAYVAEEVDGQYPVDADFNAIENISTAPTPGTTWQAVEFEHLAVTWGVTFSWFKHLLTVESKGGPDTYRFDYALKKSLRSGVLGDERDGGLDVDDGYASATLRPDGWIDIEATKALRFSERPFLTKLLNTWAVVALAAMGDELWEIVCCVP